MADSENILTWNTSNWITVVLMVAGGFFVVGLLQKWYSQRSA
jgi:hypothetical protein